MENRAHIALGTRDTHSCIKTHVRAQVEALADEEVVEGPIYVTINVLDVNNKAPYFNQSVYTAVVRENTPAGCAHFYLLWHFCFAYIYFLSLLADIDNSYLW